MNPKESYSDKLIIPTIVKLKSLQNLSKKRKKNPDSTK